MDIFDVLSFDERIIVYSSVGERALITWNRSLTLQWWRPVVRLESEDYPSGQFNLNDWEEVDIQTLSKEPRNYEEARQAAIHWYTGG